MWLVILGVGGYLAWEYWLPRSVKDRITTATRGGHQVILDERFGVPAKSWQARGVRLDGAAEVTISVVCQGDGVNVMLVPGSEWNQRHGDSLEGIRHLTAFQMLRATRNTKSGRLRAGTYYVVVQNPTWGLMTRANFDVHLRVEAVPN